MAYTYTTLQTDIIANMEEDSDEFLEALPQIVSRAEELLRRRIEPPAVLRVATVTVSASVRTIDLPSDLMVLKSVTVSTTTGRINLLQQTNEYLTEYWPVPTSVGTPKYYAPKDHLQIYVAPTPAVNATADVEYMGEVTALSSAAPSNWYSEKAGAALFAAAMLYANAWTKNGSALAFWKSQVDEEMTAINNEARRSRRSDTSDRSGGPPENTLAGQT